jgi:hypothetical protein
MQSVMNQLKVTPLRRDAESTNQLINLETTHACVITDPVTNRSHHHYPNCFHS